MLPNRGRNTTLYGISRPGNDNKISYNAAAFGKLLQQPGIGPQGCCLEIHSDAKDVRCLVPLKDIA